MITMDSPVCAYGLIKCSVFLIFNTAFLVIGILLYVRKPFQYGDVIRYETMEWNKAAITDLIGVS